MERHINTVKNTDITKIDEEALDCAVADGCVARVQAVTTFPTNLVTA